MNFMSTISAWGSKAWNAITDLGSATADVSGFMWRYATASVHAYIHVLTHPLGDVENVAAVDAGLLTGNLTAIHNALLRLYGFAPATWVKPHVTRLTGLYEKLLGIIMDNVHRLWRRIDWVNKQTRQWAAAMLRRERGYRIAGDRKEHAFTQQQAKATLGTVQRQAASGYRAEYQGRVDTVVHLLGNLATDDPVVKTLVGDLVKALVDVGSVEDPLLRLGLGFVMSQVIDRLGIDRAAGELARSLLGPLLGQPRPQDLHDVIRDIAQRLGAVEGEWATFMSDGGPEILAAGKEWAQLDAVGLDVALLAFAGAAVTDPEAVATGLADLIRPVGTGIIADIAHLLGSV